jgi:tricorn protease
MFRLPPVWSPDSKKLLFADKDVRLFYVDLETKQPVLVDQGKYDELTDYCWSPDSKWVAYAKAAENRYEVIHLYSLADRKIAPVTTSFTHSWNPVFDPSGKYLLFLSNRDYNEVLGVFDFEFANPKATRVYVITLRADLPSPFAPKSDEAGAKEPEAVPPKEEAKTEAKPGTREVPKDFRVDLAGIIDRVVALPIPPANMRGLNAGKDTVYYVTNPVAGLSGPLAGETAAIHGFDLKERKDSVVIAQADQYTLSFDGAKLLYSAPKEAAGGEEEEEEPGPGARTYGIIDAKPPEKEPHKVGEGALNLTTMRVEVNPVEEWNQIFHEVWRQQRDYFFEVSMSGVDWAKEREKYAQLLPHVANRFDLNYVLGEMIGELSTSHTYVGGGDYPNLKPVNVGVLGVDFEADAAQGLYRFKKIYPGENWQANLRSPLTEPGVGVKDGEYLLAVNGRALRVPRNPYELFANAANENVTLTVNSKPSEEGGRNVVVKPLASEFKLRELDMINTNRKKVEEATGSRVGYIYIPDMSASGLNEFVKQYFPQIRKEGLIIDVRYNGGGFVDQLIFERLRRILVGMDSARNWESMTIPDSVFHGHMVCITNEYAASDGDIFTFYFKKYKLGPVVGMRTWGGVRGIRGYVPLIDGGYITRPEFAIYGLDSQWLIENRGVEPDIVVDNPPDLVMKGRDPQLEKAIELVMKAIQEQPKKLPPRPPDLPAYPQGPG